MRRLKTLVSVVFLAACYVFAWAVLVHFLQTGEIWVRHAGWIPLRERPVAAAMSLFATLVVILLGTLGLWLAWAGRNGWDRHLRALDQRNRLDRARCQPKSGDQA